MKIIVLFNILFTVSLVKSDKLDDDRQKYTINSDVLSFTDFKTEQIPSIFINQSSNIHIVAKYGQTVNLPCIIYKLKNQDLSQIHAIWHKLVDKQRPIVLSIGSQQLKQDMRYRVKQISLNKETNIDDDKLMQESHANEVTDYVIENWQFEIRKLTFEDAGTYQCLLPLVKPITRNITLKILPEIVIEPKEANFVANKKILMNCNAIVKLHHNRNQEGKFQRHQKPVLNWYKENELVRNVFNPNNKHKIEIINNHNMHNHSLSSVLVIYNAREEDSGKYTCSYENHRDQTTIIVLNEDDARNNYMMSSLNNAITFKSNQCILFAFSLITILSLL